MALPGISFEIVRSAGPVLGIRSDRGSLLALTERGPVETPALVHSYDEYVREFGCVVDGMLGPLAARLYFENGGEELIVTRFVPAAALEATGSLATVGASGAAVPIALRARDPGAFGDRISVRPALSVRRRGKGVLTTADTLVVSALSAPLFAPADVGVPIRVIMQIAALTVDFWTRVASVSALVGASQTLTLAAPVPSWTGTPVAVAELYEPTFALRISEPTRPDILVGGLDLRDVEAARVALASTPITISSPSTPSAELPKPATVVKLKGGDDGLAIPPVPADLELALSALEASFERCLAELAKSELPDIVFAPDLWSRVFATKGVPRLAFDAERARELGDKMALSALVTRDRVVLLDPPLAGRFDLRPAVGEELAAWRAEREQALAEGPDSARDFVATYVPWLRIVAGPVYRGDDTLLFPPSASVAGQMAKTSRERGPWIATGNVALEGAVALDQVLESEAAEDLQDIGLNPLLMSLPRGATIQGVRSLAWPDRKPWRFLSTRRLFNYLRRALKPIGLSYVFEPNSPATWIALRRDIERLLSDLFAAGALAGTQPGEAYFVKIDDTLNPEEARQNGVLTAQIAVAPAKPLEFLLVRLQVVGGVARVTEEPIVA